MKKKPKPKYAERTLAETVRLAVIRGCRTLAIGPPSPDGVRNIDAGWEPEPMATWIAPTVIRAVNRWQAAQDK